MFLYITGVKYKAILALSTPPTTLKLIAQNKGNEYLSLIMRRNEECGTSQIFERCTFKLLHLLSELQH